MLLIKAVLGYSRLPLAPPPPLSISPQTLVPFHNLGLLVGLFAPRCADTWTTTRQEAVGCVYSLLYLQLGYEGEPCWGCGDCGSRSWVWGQPGITGEGFSQLWPLGFSRDHRDDVAERLLTLKDGLAHADPTILFHTCHSIAQVLMGFQ